MAERLTIDELAGRVGMTARNIREHQTRGLLPPPTVTGRVGWYDERHIARLSLIKDLQAEGLNLQAIAWLIERAPGHDLEEVSRLTRALFAPWGDETPVRLNGTELAERLGPIHEATLARAQELDVIRPVGSDAWEAPSPRLIEAGEQLAALGVALDDALDVVAELRRSSRTAARALLELFRTNVWEPFEEAGTPPEDWPRVRQALERLRPLAAEALLATFHQAMGEAIEARLAEVLAELSADRHTA